MRRRELAPPNKSVRERHAPVDALRQSQVIDDSSFELSQGAPRTCRCIETHHPRWSVGQARGQGAPRTRRRIEHFLPEGFWGGLGVAVSSSWSSIGSRGAGFEGSIEIGNGPGSAPRGRPCGVAGASAVPGRVPSGSGVRCGAGRGGAAHSTGTRRRRIRGIMRKRLDDQRR